MPTGTALPLIRLPGFEYPANAKLDFSPMERALARYQDTQLNLTRMEREDERHRELLGLQRNRFDLERQRFGLEEGRFGLETRRTAREEDQARLAREEADRQEQERRNVRLGNLAWRYRNISDPTHRSAQTIQFIWNTPGLVETLGRHGIRLNRHESGVEDYDRALDFIIGQVQDARTRYQPNILHGGPGTGFFNLETDAGGEHRLTPLARVPERVPPLSDTAIGRLNDQGRDAGNVLRLSETWNDAFTVPGWRGAVGGGDWQNWIGSTFSNANPTTRAAAQWWRDYYRNIGLIEQHGLFGASLTPNEIRAWREATITPNMAPDVIRNSLRIQREMVEGRMLAHGRTLVLQGQDPRVVAQALGLRDPGVLTGQPPPSPEHEALRGRARRAISNGESRTLIIERLRARGVDTSGL